MSRCVQTFDWYCIYSVWHNGEKHLCNQIMGWWHQPKKVVEPVTRGKSGELSRGVIIKLLRSNVFFCQFGIWEENHAIGCYAEKYMLVGQGYVCLCTSKSVIYTVPCESIRPPWTLRPFSGFKHENIKLSFFVKNQQQVGHNHEVVVVVLTNQKLKNWACKIIQPLYFQCSKLSPEVQWGSLNDPMLT